jgi:hypothetical protein
MLTTLLNIGYAIYFIPTISEATIEFMDEAVETKNARKLPIVLLPK